jgi:hypothetical protein
VAQAVERADTKTFNRGGEAAKSAIEMVRVMRKIREDVKTCEGGQSASQSGRMQQGGKR